MGDPENTILLEMIDQAFDHKSWHGTNLRGSIRRLKAADAAWRPATGRHNIWEIVVHAAYWKYVVRRRLLSEARGSFPLKGSNWFVRPDEAGDGEAEWKSDVALLVETHRTLREAVVGASERLLREDSSTSKSKDMDLVIGSASHDLYHAGQIQLLKRLRSNSEG
jgi:hypothetical protein